MQQRHTTKRKDTVTLMINVMTEELLKQKVEEYTKNYVNQFKNVAAKAYEDGLKDMQKYIIDKLSEL